MVYLLKSIACLLILLLVHRLFLQREVMHRFNRFFLLFSVVISFFIPLYTIEVSEIIEAAPTIENSSPIMAEEFTAEPLRQIQIDETPIFHAVEETRPAFNWHYLIVSIYGLITTIFLFRFVRNIKILVNQIKQNVKINYKGQTLVLLQGNSLPYSFLNYIFVTESDFENGKFSDAVFSHERTHIEEKHSWDNLFIELLMIPLWLHPGLYWAKAAIKLNHEFIADKAALQSTPLEKYENQLLSMMVDKQKFGLVSSLNFSLTKKRFEMMKRKSTGSTSWIKVLCLVPVLGMLVYIFSEKVTAKTEGVEPKAEAYVNASEAIAGEEEFVHRIKQQDPVERQKPSQEKDKEEYFKNASLFVENEAGELVAKSYSELSDAEKSMLMLPPGVPEKKTPSAEQFDQWKNPDKYAMWLDGKHIPNVQLDQMNNSDIAFFFDSYVHNNARSERFPQERQVNLYTAAGYDRSYGPDSGFGVPLTKEDRLYLYPSAKRVNFGKAWVKKGQDPVAIYLKIYNDYERKYVGKSEEELTEREQAEAWFVFSELGGRFFQLAAADKKKVPRAARLSFPYMVRLMEDGKVYYKKFDELTDEEKKQVPPPPPPIQKEESNELPPPPPPVRKNSDPVAVYRKELSQFEVIKNEQNAFRKKTPQEIKQIYGMFIQLRDAYQEMALEDQKKVRPANFPYAVVQKEGELVFKNREDLTTDEKNMMGC